MSAHMDTIAVAFDFDDTLAPDSTSSFLANIGVDTRAFWKKEVKPLMDEGWDPVPAYLSKMVEVSNEGDGAPRITEAELAAWGKKIKFFPGVLPLFGRLRKHVAGLSRDLQVEFYLISSGIGTIVRNTRIAKEFTDIWANEFDFGPDGGIRFPKRVVSFTDKTRYVFQISKGVVGAEYRSQPFAVNKKVSTEQLRVPLSHMIYVGDGYTDVPCFALLTNSGGIALGVYDNTNREKWGRAWGFLEDRRVTHLAAADYRKSTALHDALIMGIESIARQILVRRSSYRG